MMKNQEMILENVDMDPYNHHNIEQHVYSDIRF